jgi:hypothetical protein
MRRISKGISETGGITVYQCIRFKSRDQAASEKWML